MPPSQPDVSLLSLKNTRNKKIDFSKLGQKKTLSNSSCHKCKTMIPVNEENICMGGFIETKQNTESLKRASSSVSLSGSGAASGMASHSKLDKKKNIEPCALRFCNDCLEKHYRETWLQKKKSPETWICPVCCGTCNCSQCARKKNKETNIKIQQQALKSEQEKLEKKQIGQSHKAKKDQNLAAASIKSLNKRQEKGQNKRIQQLSKGQPIIEINQKTKIDSVQLQKQQYQEPKPAVSDGDLRLFMSAKQKFNQSLQKHDWSYVPGLQRLKMELFPEERAMLLKQSKERYAQQIRMAPSLSLEVEE